MVFNETSAKNGIIQEIEFWTLLGDGAISSDTTLLKTITSRVNQGFDRLTAYLYSWGDYLRWDDTNNTDAPIGTFTLASGAADVVLATDDNSLAILNIVKVMLLTPGSTTNYFEVEQITADDERAAWVMSPNTTWTGTPTVCLRRGNTLLFDRFTTASMTGKIFFEREPNYFVSTDTTKEPGIPKPFHGLLPLYAAYDWVLVNKGDQATLITRLEEQIKKREGALCQAIDARYPTKHVMRGSKILYL